MLSSLSLPTAGEVPSTSFIRDSLTIRSTEVIASICSGVSAIIPSVAGSICSGVSAIIPSVAGSSGTGVPFSTTR